MALVVDALKVKLGAFGWAETIRRDLRLPGGAAGGATPATAQAGELDDYLQRMGVDNAAARSRLTAALPFRAEPGANLGQAGAPGAGGAGREPAPGLGTPAGAEAVAAYHREGGGVGDMVPADLAVPANAAAAALAAAAAAAAAAAERAQQGGRHRAPPAPAPAQQEPPVPPLFIVLDSTRSLREVQVRGLTFFLPPKRNTATCCHHHNRPHHRCPCHHGRQFHQLLESSLNPARCNLTVCAIWPTTGLGRRPGPPRVCCHAARPAPHGAYPLPAGAGAPAARGAALPRAAGAVRAGWGGHGGGAGA